MKLYPLLLPVVISVSISSAFAAGVPVTAFSVEEGFYQPSIVITGKLEAQEHARLIPRVSGYLQQQYYPDGAHVTKGDVLFQIDDTPYKLALRSAIANEQQAAATKQQAHLNHNRTKELVLSGSATAANLDDASATLSIAEAGLAKAKASVANARNDLWHTKIRAPYDGQLGKANFSVGDMVSPNAGPVIDIAQLDPLNASFSLGESDYTRFPIDQSGEVIVSLEEHGKYGTVSFIDNKVNTSTGTLLASATFPNLDNTLRPNQVVRVLLTREREKKGFWVPQSAVMQDLMMQFVYVISDKGLAERREVEVLSREGNKVFIQTGVSKGEQIITDGLVRVRPNVPVLVQE